MESIRGKQPLSINALTLAARMHRYPYRLIDLGTGDGQFVCHVAKRWPGYFAVGVDACRENLHAISRTAPTNACFVIANVLNLPSDLFHQATHITINFPWGSLLNSLLTGDPVLTKNLGLLTQPGGEIALRLNESALHIAGSTIDEGAELARWVLRNAGFEWKTTRVLGAHELRRVPTSWAKRVAFGGEPRAVAIEGVFRT
jgi:trans-aconitate methyltransferase